MKVSFRLSPNNAAFVAAFFSFVLALAKLFLFWFTSSLTIGLSALDSIADIVISLINQKIMHYAHKDADDEHPYGYGKAEALASLGQGILILGGSLVIIQSSIKYFVTRPTTPDSPLESWMIIFFLGSAFSAYVISQFLKFYGKKENSLVLIGDSKHYEADAVINIGTALALGLILYFRKPFIDPLIAGISSLFVGFQGFQLIQTSLKELMDLDIGPDMKKDVIAFIFKIHPGILDIHKFRGRKSGKRYFFDFHVTLPKDLSFIEVHTIVELLEENLQKVFSADVIIHSDPFPEKES